MGKEENLILTKQQAAILQRLLDDLQSEWVDNASQEIHSLYLNPHHDNKEFMLQAFEAQFAFLSQSIKWLNEADQQMLQNRIAREEIEEHLNYTEQQIEYTEEQLTQSIKYERIARSQLLDIQKLINLANRGNH